MGFRAAPLVWARAADLCWVLSRSVEQAGRLGAGPSRIASGTCLAVGILSSLGVVLRDPLSQDWGSGDK